MSETIIITGSGDNDAAKQADERNKGKLFKKCVPFTDCISEISKTRIDNAKDIDIVMPMHHLIEYSVNYSKTSGTSWQYCRDKPNDNVANPELFRSQIKITGNTPKVDKKKN